MKNVMMGLSAIAAAATLSACSSSASFEDMTASHAALVSTYENAEPTAVENMPTTGTATYEGNASFETSDGAQDPNPEQWESKLVLDADFAASTISGEMTNVTPNEGEAAEGSIGITNGAISGNTMTAELDGTLTDPDGIDFTVEGEMSGKFRGDAAATVGGEFFGTATAGDDTVAIQNGEFVAEK